MLNSYLNNKPTLSEYNTTILIVNITDRNSIDIGKGLSNIYGGSFFFQIKR